ncbi:amidohydrolase family protein [Fibrobacterota bacterium]
MTRIFLFPLAVLSFAFDALAVRQEIYPIGEIPIVDTHVHMRGGRSDFDDIVSMMDQWGGTLAISMDGGGDMNEMDYIQNSLDGRILLTAQDYSMGDGMWDVDEITDYANAGYSGFKVFNKYQMPMSEVEGHSENFQRMAEVGLPVMGFHIGDPPEGSWSVPDKYMIYHKDAEVVMSNHPSTTFIMAHMFWLCCNDTSLDTLSMFMDRTPNIYLDMAATFHYFNPPQPSYDKLRDFIITYKDRILYGTDGNAGHSSSQWSNTREMMETDDEGLSGFFGGGGMQGLGLPVDVLNYIYYWNASRLIPGVKEALENQGYVIGDEPPTEDVTATIGPDGPQHHPQYLDERQVYTIQGKKVLIKDKTQGKACKKTNSLPAGKYVETR